MFTSGRRRRRGLFRGFIDVAALADVILLLFLFYLAHSSFILQPGISMDLPSMPFRDGTLDSAKVVTLTQEGLVFYDDERTTLDGLASAFAQARHDDPSTRLIIEADRRVPHGTLVAVYRMASEAGLQGVTLATRMPAAPSIP
jgi:biopolymer transport protein ExbD